MSYNANSDKPHLTLIKKHVNFSNHFYDEFEFDFGEEDEIDDDFLYPELDEVNEGEISFTSLLWAQSKLLQRIVYFADELEFNLD